jgi:dihydropteroate synthase
MGILNATPDSFFADSRVTTETGLLRRAEELLREGADFIDIGGYSSRPGAADVAQAEELSRVVPAIAAITKRFPEALVSVDTFRSAVVKASVDAGAAMVNDISAGTLDAGMLETIAALRVPYVMMHMRGNPQTMKTLTGYGDIIKEMLFYFSERVAAARALGVNDIIIDPGFGFAKTLEQNYHVFARLESFRMLELPLLIGVSRKGMVYNALETTASRALNGTTALHMAALIKGARMLRVHDVKEAVETVKLFGLINR